MKIIVSHDVDHLDSTDHLFRDLILEKMFIRSFIQFLKKEISLKTCMYRMTMVFHKRMNRIEEVMEYDKKNKIPSVFFFGMDNVLGMSYTDSYNMAWGVVNNILYMITTAISVAFIPVYVKKKSNDGILETKKFATKIITFMLLLAFCVVLALELWFNHKFYVMADS